ncbi:FAD/NAD(P)-binding domain-containing protein [Thozetella sp. PMI_491]|nr:FAD/NAD(P)-binding domain-containing protein [Thozetella sp. PMI_491]
MAFSSRPLDIITVGGSLAGLMTSISLRRLGHNVRILEQSPTPLLDDQGAGVVLGSEVREFLRLYDKTQTPAAADSHVRLYLDKEGALIHQEGFRQQMTSWDLLYHICRANFDSLESSYIQRDIPVLDSEGAASYEHGSLVTSLDLDGVRIKVSYKNTLQGVDAETIHTTQADFVVIADGQSSSMRKALCSGSPEQTYAGYIAFHGMVPEMDLSPDAQEAFVEKFASFHTEGEQLIAYVAPGIHGNLAPGKRIVNWAWYTNVMGGSRDYRTIMTDQHGTRHPWFLPSGSIAPKIWERQKQRAEQQLPWQFRELVAKTVVPLVQAVTDLPPLGDKKTWVLGGKGVLVGDCLAGFRPHTGASTSQAALHATLLPRVFARELDLDLYEREVMQFVSDMQAKGGNPGP